MTVDVAQDHVAAVEVDDRAPHRARAGIDVVPVADEVLRGAGGSVRADGAVLRGLDDLRRRFGGSVRPRGGSRLCRERRRGEQRGRPDGGGGGWSHKGREPAGPAADTADQSESSRPWRNSRSTGLSVRSKAAR